MQAGQIKIEPKPKPEPDAYASTSVDLKLAKDLLEFKQDIKTPGLPDRDVVDPSESGFRFDQLAKLVTDRAEISGEGFMLNPNQFVLGWTEESVALLTSSRIAARVEGKSSLARLGVCIHITAPTIHAGFQGRIQLEIKNHGSMRIKLRVGMPICQLIFEQTLGTPEKGYSGQFLHQGR